MSTQNPSPPKTKTLEHCPGSFVKPDVTYPIKAPEHWQDRWNMGVCPYCGKLLNLYLDGHLHVHGRLLSCLPE